MEEAVKRMSADERAAVLLERAATLAPLRLERHQLNKMTMKGRKPMKIKELVEGTWL